MLRPRTVLMLAFCFNACCSYSVPLAAQTAETTTPTYKYNLFFNESPNESVGSFASRRVAHSDGSFTIETFSPNELRTPTDTMTFDSVGVPVRSTSIWKQQNNGIEYGDTSAMITWNGKTTTVEVDRNVLAQPHQKWFWKTSVDPGEKAVEKTVSQNTGEINPARTLEYLRREQLKVMGKEIACHVVKETRANNATSNDIYWFDELGMMVKQVHTVDGLKRTTKLVDKIKTIQNGIKPTEQDTTDTDKVSAEKFIERLGNKSEAIFHDNNRLTFMIQTDAAKSGLTTVLQIPFEQHKRSGVYIGDIEIPDSDQLVLSYAFTKNDENGMRNLKHYVGPNGPAIPQSVASLEGELFKYRIPSTNLDEPRNVQVYVPKRKDNQTLPVIYLTDGDVLSEYVGSLDWKIQTGKIAPIIAVGVHNGGYIGNREKAFESKYDNRAKEYLSGLGSDRYEKHNKFLREEVMPFVEKTHGASSVREERMLSGFSNGGAYSVTASVKYPELFGHVFAYSVAFFDREVLKDAVKEQADNGKKLPRYRFAAGTLEGFIKGTKEAHQILVEGGADCENKTFIAGHDPLMWKIALLEDLENQFPGANSTRN